MFKRFFQSNSGEGELQPEEVVPLDDSSRERVASPILKSEKAERTIASPTATVEAPSPTSESFDDVYSTAAVKPPKLTVGILKVAEMAVSPHLAGMSPEHKRNSILMALDAAGADVDYLLEDAVFRQRALNDREDAMQKRMSEFEAAKSSEIATIQAELARITSQSMARIQANLDEIAREHEKLRAWQTRKQAETNRIADAAGYLVPKNSQLSSTAIPSAQAMANQLVNESGFSNLLERGTTASRR